MDFIILSGLSGSGKSVALQSLEDLGYYCIDNLPVVLLREFLNRFEETAGSDRDRAAISIDSRNREFLEALPDALKHLRQIGYSVRIVFLEADDKILIQRYSETRRKHPLTDAMNSLPTGISMERELLAPLERQADCRISTTNSTPHELRSTIREFAGGNLAGRPTLFFQSFGFKHGTPNDADFIFDVRCLPNPHWEPAFRPLTGEDPKIIEFLDQNENVQEMVRQLEDFLEYWLPLFEAENRSYLTIGVGCTGGHHRSVYIINRLAQAFRDRGRPVQWHHRELRHYR